MPTLGTFGQFINLNSPDAWKTMPQKACDYSSSDCDCDLKTWIVLKLQLKS